MFCFWTFHWYLEPLLFMHIYAFMFKSLHCILLCLFSYAWVKGELLWSLTLIHAYITPWVLSSSKLEWWAFGPTTPSGDRVARVDTEQVKDIDENVKLFAPTRTKIKPRKWVKKHESQACDRDKLKLKAVVLHDGSEKVHMIQPDRFAV